MYTARNKRGERGRGRMTYVEDIEGPIQLSIHIL